MPKRIEFKGKTIQDELLSLKNPISFSFNINRFIPCDNLELTLPLQYENKEFCELFLYIDEKLIFEGIVDRQIILKDEHSNIIKFECRNKTALLIDNEVKPNFYTNLSSRYFIEKYTIPLGIKKVLFPYETSLKNFLIKKGLSYYELIEQFCILAYKKIPYINPDMILTLNPLSQKTHTFSNQCLSATRYSNLTVKYMRDKLISTIYMKTATQTNDYYYDFSIDNHNAISKKIKRERYCHPASIINSDAENEIKRILKKSNSNSFSIELTLPFLYECNIGDSAKLIGSKIYDNLYISSIGYIASQNDGIITKLILLDKQYI